VAEQFVTYLAGFEAALEQIPPRLSQSRQRQRHRISLSRLKRLGDVQICLLAPPPDGNHIVLFNCDLMGV
jgi:hypothetical protein